MTCQTAGGEILGIPARVPNDGNVYLHNQRLGRVINTAPDKVLDQYLYWLFLSPEFNRELVASASGTKILHTAPSRIEAFNFSLPPISEQQVIANILDALNDKIELNRRMNATLEAMAQVLFKSWFVDFDPVKAKAAGRAPEGMDADTAALFPSELVESELGLIPKRWEALPLYETARFINGAAFKSEDFCEPQAGLPVIKIAELKDGISTQTKWSQRKAAPDQLITTGDLLYSWSGSPDTSLDAFLWTNGAGLLNQHIFKVIAADDAQTRFVYYLLKYLRPVLVEIARNKQTTGLGHVTVANMKRLLVCWPSKDIMTAFDRNVAAIFDRAFANSIESQTLADMRDALLPKLISGQLRISDAEAMAEAVV